MKKISILLAVFICTMFCALGCGGNTESDNVQNDSTGKTKIVCTIFSEYDWVKELVKGSEDYEITLLMDDGADLHSFQPSMEDIMTITDADMFIYVGGESDEWIEDVMSGASKKPSCLINLMEILNDYVVKEEEPEGIEDKHHHHVDAEDEESHAEHEEAYEQHDAEHEDEYEQHDEEHEEEYDEHLWLSLRAAKEATEKIADALIELNPDRSSLIEENKSRYINELKELDDEYVKAVESASNKAILVADRFPFRYLVDDYGLEYYAAFSGCSAETEASFETIDFLSNTLDRLDLPCVYILENSNDDLANQIVRNSDDKSRKVIVLDSLQSVITSDIEAGATYLNKMEKNLDSLRYSLLEQW